MKLGIYGGIANNMYLFAKAAARRRWNVVFIRDRGDRYPFSQPVWEDARCTMTYDQTLDACHWTWDRWTRWETDRRWTPPPWLCDPLASPRRKLAMPGVTSLLDRTFLRTMARRRPHWSGALQAMAPCDVLIVCGIEGTLLARMSGRPYILMPHGGDIRMAAGLDDDRPANPLARAAHWACRRALRAAYRGTSCVAMHDPASGGGLIADVPAIPAHRLTDARFVFLPIPIPSADHPPREQRRALLADLMAQLGLPVPEADTVGLVPSRVDFFWKGQDRLFRAMRNLRRPGAIHLVISGWGADIDKARRMTAPETVTFLPAAVSKPILYDFFAAADFVVDQFRLGTYGMSALEAMSRGAPVLMRVDEDMFRENNLEAPPVLNAASEEQVADVLRGIVEGRIDLDDVGRRAAQWARRTHGEPDALDRWEPYIQAAAANPAATAP